MATLRGLWLRWKMLKLPWRKTFLIGQDLSGNTFWEFKDKLNPGNVRRIARPCRRSQSYADLAISPQWHQWLRQTRVEPPTIQEQHGDIVRQTQLKRNARLADERWEAKARYIEKPKQRTPLLAMKSEGKDQVTIEANDTVKIDSGSKTNVTSAVDAPKPPKELKQNPWAQSDAGSKPGSKYQPEAWTPGPAKR